MLHFYKYLANLFFNTSEFIEFKWTSQKKKWYFHTDTFRKKSRKTLSMEDIQNYYGSTTVKAINREQIAQT